MVDKLIFKLCISRIFAVEVTKIYNLACSKNGISLEVCYLPPYFLDGILLIYSCILKSLKPNGLKMQQHPLFRSWTYNLDGAWEEQLHFAQLSVNLKWLKG